jgi:uncharacterized protein (DUF1015 family)
MTSSDSNTGSRLGRGLSLAPFRALRPAADGEALASRLSPPYDVISAAERARLLAGDADNVVSVILPAQSEEGYAQAADQLRDWVSAGSYAPDPRPAIYVYEMSDTDGNATRGLVGAVELRDPADGVILPHENTMAGPVADRLALMTATEADLEPIYLVYDGGGAASEVVRHADKSTPLVETTTPDGIRHRLWAVDDVNEHAVIANDLAERRALIADGHHRYATYRERQRRMTADHGAGPWDRGLALLVDSSDYGPQVHAIHRVIPALDLDTAVGRLTQAGAQATPAATSDAGLEMMSTASGFAAVITDGAHAVVVTDDDGALNRAAIRPGEPAEVAELDVTVLHRGVIEHALALPDTEQSVGYAHSVEDALHDAVAAGGLAILLRPTPVAAVAAVAAAGARMPRKSTLFTPKPASGLLMRRFADQS